MAKKSLEERFWEKVAKSDGCWEWQAAKLANGYGIFRGDAERLAHRVAWTLCHGAIPIKLQVLHRCDNKACVRPAHLFLGTQKDNMLDMIAKGRARRYNRRGEHNPNAKINLNIARGIRAEWQGNRTPQKQLAVRHGISLTQIEKILGNRVWRETPDLVTTWEQN